MTRNERAILLVEDNPGDVKLMLRALKLHQIQNEVVVARDGVEALDYLFGIGSHAARDPHALPEIVILDLNLPKVNGIEVLRRIRTDERTRMLPVIMLTTSTEERDVVASYRHGINSYVQKPMDFDVFSLAVRQLALYWLNLNINPPPPEAGQ
ncbi:MAG: response regulator [Verrucomicrobiota bacterium]